MSHGKRSHCLILSGEGKVTQGRCQISPMDRRYHQTPGISLYRARWAYSSYPANSFRRVRSSQIVRRTSSGPSRMAGIKAHREESQRHAQEQRVAEEVSRMSDDGIRSAVDDLVTTVGLDADERLEELVHLDQER
jgi:hypothetical protein